MIDIKYPYRCRATGIRGWIPLEKPVNIKDYRIQLCMSRIAYVKYHGVKMPGFSQPTDLPDFGKIFMIEKNPNYVKPHPNWVAVVINNEVAYVPRFESKMTTKQKRTQAKAIANWKAAKKKAPVPTRFVAEWTAIIKTKKAKK